MQLNLQCKSTHLRPQCQGLQTYSLHHREWGLLQQVKWAAWVSARRRLLWPTADGVNCRLQEKHCKRLSTAHLHSSSTIASLSRYLSSRTSEKMWFVYNYYYQGADSSIFSPCAPFIPCPNVRLLLPSKAARWRTWKTRDNKNKDVFKCVIEGSLQVQTTLPFLVQAVACCWYYWHRWWVSGTCTCTERQHFLEDMFK